MKPLFRSGLIAWSQGCVLLLSLALFPAPASAGDGPPGQRISVGSHSLHISCLGKGSPAVILDAGLGASGADWRRIQNSLAATTRVCAYDRAGYGGSDAGPSPRTSGRIAAELHTLLKKAAIPPPYILAGHSFGGYNMRLFASRFPRETAGLVLVDAPHEDQVEGFLNNYLLRQLDPQGLLQTFWRPELLDQLFSANLAPLATLLGVDINRLRAIVGEAAAFRESSQELRTAESQPDIPLVVIMHGQRVLPAGALGDQVEQQWLALQRDLATRYRNSTVIIARNSGHNILFEQPDLVADAIRKVVADQRRGHKGPAPAPAG